MIPISFHKVVTCLPGVHHEDTLKKGRWQAGLQILHSEMLKLLKTQKRNIKKEENNQTSKHS